MHRTMERLARVMALVGGLVLVSLIVLTCVSVLGRGLNTLGHSAVLTSNFPAFAEWLIASGVAPVTGDFELVEASIAFAIFAFLPICQLHKSHATVDVFTDFLPAGANRFLIMFWEVVLCIVMVLLSWRLLYGVMDKFRYAETTFILQFPVWWALAFSFAASVIAALVSIYSATGHVRAWLKGQDFLPHAGGAVH